MSPPTEIDPGKQWRAGHGIPVVAVFDTYRAVAIVGVVLFHIFQVSGVFAALGGSTAGGFSFTLLVRSLDVLFMVSGFVMFLPTVARRGEFGSIGYFGLRRAARLLPAYWVCLGIALLLVLTAGHAEEFPSVSSIILHLSVLQTPAQLFTDNVTLGFGVVPPVWTLSVEVGFYLLLPLIATTYFRRPFVGLAAAAAIVVGWHLLGTNADSLSSTAGIDLGAGAESRIETFYASQLPAWSFALACGMTGAWCYVWLLERGLSPRVQVQCMRIATLAAVTLVAIAWIAGGDALYDPSAFEGLFARQSPFLTLTYAGLIGIALIGLAASPASARRPFEHRLLRWTGDISYAIYLIHFAVIWLVLRELNLPNDGSVTTLLVWCAAVYPPSFLYAYLSARFVERPVRRWAHRFGRRAQARASEPRPATKVS